MGVMKRLNVKRMLKNARSNTDELDNYRPRPAFTYKPRQAKKKQQRSKP